MRREVRAEPMFGWVRRSLWYRCEILLMGRPNVFVESGPRCVTGGADALETSFISALVNSSAFGDGILGAGCVRAKDDLCTSVDMTVSE